MGIFSSLFSSFEAIFLVIIFFGGSIFVHELGHFIAAKRRKLFIPRFSIGFGPRICSKTIGDTEFCISLFPIGGYVALPQLMEIKELEGKYSIPSNISSISWVDKVIVAVMGAVFNIVFAFFLATILWFVGIERPQNTTNNIIGYICPEITLPNGEKVISPAKAAGLEIGDQIIAIDGIKTHDFNDIVHGIALGEKRDGMGPLSVITVLRAEQIHNFILHPVLVEQGHRPGELLRIIGVETYQELFVRNVYENTPAQYAGLQSGDKLCSINGEKLFSYSQFADVLERVSEFELTIERNEKEITVPIRREKLFATRPFLRIATEYGIFEALPIFNDENAIIDPYGDQCSLQLLSMDPEFQKKFPQCKIGDSMTHIQQQIVHNMADSSFMLQNIVNVPATLTFDRRDCSLLIKKVELIPSEPHYGIGAEFYGAHVLIHENPFHQIGRNVYLTFHTFKSLLSPSSDVHLKNLMGPPGILDTLYTFAGYGLRLLLWLVILLNVNLAIFNLLPIPVLDGGVIALALLEKIFRRKIATHILASVQLVFMALSLGMVIYVSFFDINRILSRRDAKEFYLKKQKLFIDEQLFWNGLKGATSHPH